MHIADILKSKQPSFSFEFFPPKTEAASEKLFREIRDLMPLKPAYVSVTYGAGGSSRELTHDLIVRIQRETELTVISHLTTVGHNKSEVAAILDQYEEAGIRNILALRGDPPNGQAELAFVEDGFPQASDLVSFIKERYPHFGIGVAGFPEGHPDCPNRLLEIDYLKRKVDAGADYIITQLFFDNRDFYDFVERCRLAGITVPIVAGIMPITSRNSMKRMAEMALGARYPARLLKALGRAQSDELAAKVGIHWATEQVRDLWDSDVQGVHFYTLNRSMATREIYQSLGLHQSEASAESSLG
jgi:methylenetetrahydrofolate reductase (NADPH)